MLSLGVYPSRTLVTLYTGAYNTDWCMARAAHGRRAVVAALGPGPPTARRDGAFAAVRWSRHTPASIAKSGMVGGNILARVTPKRQHVGIFSGRSRLGGGSMVVAGAAALWRKTNRANIPEIAKCHSESRIQDRVAWFILEEVINPG